MYDARVSVTQQDLEAAYCWEASDRVPGRPGMTEFRRSLRYHQARWREANGHPIGTQPIVPKTGKDVRPVGSRLPLGYAKQTGANFVTSAALKAARARTSVIEHDQSFDHQGLWADLLSSTAMSFNLFGDLAADLELADRTVHTWWPDTPGTVSAVRFEHSPGRLDMEYIGSLVSFAVAFIIDLGDGSRGILAMAAKYHDRIQPHTPKPVRLQRYLDVTERSGAFRPGAVDGRRSDLVVTWLEHLLMLSMMQHPSGIWRWGRYVVVHPEGNSDYAEGCSRYRGLLTDESTFGSATIEQLLDAGVVQRRTTSGFRERYLPG